MDVAVVGASAAGLAATLAAARLGAEVTLYESRSVLGVPAAPAIVGFDFLWPAAIDRPKRAVRRRLAGMHLRASDGRGPLVDAPLTLFDRQELDQHLAAEAQKSGARIETGAAIDVEALWARAKVVVFADGARSQASRYLRPTRDPAGLAWGGILEFEAAGDADRLLLTFGPHAPRGRSQLNPLGDGRWSHWTFFRGDPADAEAIGRRAFALDAALHGWKVADARFVGVAPDSAYTLPGQLAAPGLLVAGGAAGQGGLEVGLASGWLAGETAARVARGEAMERDYERAWRTRYQHGHARLRRAADALARLTDAETRALFGAWDGARLTPDAGARPLARNPRGALALAWAAWVAQARG